ncbi:MAG: hypothetical protein RLO81_01825 [Fulvivirga sp.]|uniref:hypothetical protein n=1 Tax=Fulvivirga sp. TaxID=1931237 RepID=UPI0032EFF3FD
MKKLLPIAFLSVLLISCSTQEKPISMDTLAVKYVKLVLEIGQYNSDFVDAYYGPEEWKPTGKKLDSIPIKEFISRAEGLMQSVSEIDVKDSSALLKGRKAMFTKQLTAIKTKLEMIAGKTYDFDKEAQLLYDAEPPHYTEEHFDQLLSKLDSLVPGEGSLTERFNEFANEFIIPKDKLDTVFRVAIAEARKRTLANVALPENENFMLEYVTGKNWSGYNYYQGNFESLIQINVDHPIYIERAIDLACHEGYPGHHVFNALLEKNLVVDKGWKEFSVYPLFSPQSLIAEGSANFGIEVAFPGKERVDYEKNVLFPLAGLDSTKADLYYKVLDIKGKLNYAGNEAARNYLNGKITKEEAAKWLEKYSLSTPERALQRTGFFDQYRSYVINYNLGKDIVANYVEANGGTADNPKKRWDIFKELLSNPKTASDLRVEGD